MLCGSGMHKSQAIYTFRLESFKAQEQHPPPPIPVPERCAGPGVSRGKAVYFLPLPASHGRQGEYGGGSGGGGEPVQGAMAQNPSPSPPQLLQR